MFSESILEPNLLSFNILQRKTHFTCIFQNFCFLFQSLYYAKTADTGILLETYLLFLQLAAAVNNSHCICANMYVLKSMQFQSIFCWYLNRRGQKGVLDEDELITKFFNLKFVI